METKQRWSDKDLSYLKEFAPIYGCKYVADRIGRTIKSVQHKYCELGLRKERAKIGDIINGWKIIDVWKEYAGSTYTTLAKVISDNNEEAIFRLTKLTNRQVGWPDNLRRDKEGNIISHRETESRLYRIWAGMKSRCLNPKQNSYNRYGGRGIKIFEPWLDYKIFTKWAKENGYEEHLTLDRIDVNGNYCPENCKWSTHLEQSANKENSSKTIITAFGETKSVYEWLHDDRCVLDSIAVLDYRINAGWEPGRAITQPSERKRKQKLEDWLKFNHPDIYNEFQNL